MAPRQYRARHLHPAEKGRKIMSASIPGIARTRSFFARALAPTALVGFLILTGLAPLRAYECPIERLLHLPPLEDPKDNIDKHKAQLRAYEKGMDDNRGAYYDDIKQVIDDALTYVISRADKVERPAVVLDIDETSLCQEHPAARLG
jgi:hypothetical protein